MLVTYQISPSLVLDLFDMIGSRPDHWLQAGVFNQIVYRRKPLVLLFDISGEKIKIEAYGSQAGMTQYLLKAENIASIKQIAFSKGMPESMG